MAPATVGNFQRRVVFVLLLVLMASAAGLALFLNHAMRQVGSSASTLLGTGVPSLHHVAEFEQSLLVHQLVVNRFTGHTLPHDRFALIEAQTRHDMTGQLAALEQEFGGAANLLEVRQAYEAFSRLTSEYLEMASVGQTDDRQLGDASTRLTASGIRLRGVLRQLQSTAEANVRRGGEETEAQLNDMFRLTGWFTAAVVAISMFMIYHVRARLRAEERLALAARRDPLTGLPHRTALERQLHAPVPRNHDLVLCGVDRFEEVTGSLGHASGDQLVRALASRFEQAVSLLGGLAFRMDGASFAILFAGDQSKSALALQVRAIRTAFRAPFDVDGKEIFVTLSMGSVRASEHGDSPSAMLRRADLARHAARKQGGDTWVDFHQELEAAVTDRLSMDADMRHAIDRGEFVLHYQPQQHLASGRLKGFEALLRWQHGGRTISPVTFIPLAEETGLIVQIGDWVLQEACRQAQAWNAGRNRLSMAVNISVRQLQQPDFVTRVRSIIESSGVDPTCIELEVTESIAMQDPDKAASVLLSLRSLGVSIAMDDFGTGFSSLSYLRRLPLQTLKLDRSFIQAMPLVGHRDGDIVESVIKLAHGMRLKVVAEGVETRVQLDRLRSLGCDEIQGFFYGHPLTALAAEDFISMQPGPHLPEDLNILHLTPQRS